MPPVIGVTSEHRTVASMGGDQTAHAVYTSYTSMVRVAGAIPIVLIPMAKEEAPMVLDRVDGLLLTGGGDVDPARYGAEALDAVARVDTVRDEYEIALAREAADRRMPTLAICRGLQVLNVALGGTLIQHIPDQVPGAQNHQHRGAAVRQPLEEVALDEHSTTAAALGCSAALVNSVHHQAIDAVAPGLRPTGWAPDGVIEAVEAEDALWPLLGVQWHPEWLGPEDAPSRALFEAFIGAAAAGGAAAR